jgi:hypothetical protein
LRRRPRPKLDCGAKERKKDKERKKEEGKKERQRKKERKKEERSTRSNELKHYSWFRRNRTLLVA